MLSIEQLFGSCYVYTLEQTTARHLLHLHFRTTDPHMLRLHFRTTARHQLRLHFRTTARHLLHLHFTTTVRHLLCLHFITTVRHLLRLHFGTVYSLLGLYTIEMCESWDHKTTNNLLLNNLSYICFNVKSSRFYCPLSAHISI